VAGTILIGLDRVELGYFADLIFSTSHSDDVRIEELHIVLQYGRRIPLGVDADKEHLNLLLFRRAENFVDIRDVSERRRADIWTMGETKTEQDKFAANYVWAPRFATNTSIGIVAVQYDDMGAGFFEDRFETIFGNEFRFLLWPTTNLVGEYRFQVVDYAHADRDSTTQYLLAGFDHVFSPRLAATFRGGAQLRSYTEFGDTDSPYFEGNVNYKLGKDTAVGWNFHYGIEEGDVATNTTRKSFRTGLTGKYDITARITASMSLYFYHDNYTESTFANPIVGQPPIVSPAFSENSFAIDLSVRYAINHHLGVSVGYDHNEVTSDQLGGIRDYNRNRFWGGLNFAF